MARDIWQDNVIRKTETPPEIRTSRLRLLVEAPRRTRNPLSWVGYLLAVV